jgi:hypothetical protein
MKLGLRKLRRRYGHTHVVSGPLPSGNIDWRNITPRMRVVEMTNGWAVHLPDYGSGPTAATAYWGSSDAAAAQKWLRKRAKEDA